MATVVANTSFKIAADGVSNEIVTTVGNPLTQADEVAIWFAATVPINARQTNYGTVKVLARFIKGNWAEIPATGGLMIFFVPAGGTESDIVVNGPPAPQSGDIRLEVGDSIYTSQNSNHLLVGVEYLLDFYLGASTGN